MKLPKTIYLVGYMASGKSTVGRKLADCLQYRFIDTDFFIESRFRKRTVDIFREEGEAVFRRREALIMEELAGFEHAVIATGGGLPYHSGNMQLMLDSGLVIYLSHDLPNLVHRVEQCKRTRPSVMHLMGEELTVHVQQAMSERAPIYERAHYIVDCTAYEAQGGEQAVVEYIIGHILADSVE